MQVKSIEESSKRAFSILSTFIKLPFVSKIFVLSIFEWPLKTGFTVTSISGIHEAEYFVRFAESFINPLQQLHTSEEIDDFVAQQDVCIPLT